MESRMRPAYATMVRVWLGNICLASKDSIIHTSMLERPPVVLLKLLACVCWSIYRVVVY